MRKTILGITLMAVTEAFQIPFAFGPLHFISEHQEKEWLSDHSYVYIGYALVLFLTLLYCRIAIEDSYPAEDSDVHPKFNFRFSQSTLEAQQPRQLPREEEEEEDRSLSEYERQWAQYAPPPPKLEP